MAAKKTKIAAADDKRLRETPQDESENISEHVFSKFFDCDDTLTKDYMCKTQDSL